jgi:hypothetical protein
MSLSWMARSIALMTCESDELPLRSRTLRVIRWAPGAQECR